MKRNTYYRFKNYDKIFTITSSKYILPPEILNEISKNIKGKVLDIGTGDGTKLDNILQNTDLKNIENITSIEPSPLYKKAEKRLKKYKIAKVYRSTLEDVDIQKFDSILMLEVIEHLFDIDKSLIKISKLLSKDGIFICSTPNKNVYKITERIIGKKTDPTHVNEMSWKEFNFTIEKFFKETKYMYTLPFMTIFRKIPKLFVLNKISNFAPFSRTIYCFAKKPRLTW